jgi:hypothetical protein
LSNDFDIEWTLHLRELRHTHAPGLRREEAGYDRIEFHSSKGVVAERHISTPWGVASLQLKVEKFIAALLILTKLLDSIVGGASVTLPR